MSNSNQIQAIQTALKKLSEIKNEAAFEIPPILNDPQIIETLLEIYPEADTETQQIIIFVIRNFDVMGTNELLALLKKTYNKLNYASQQNAEQMGFFRQQSLKRDVRTTILDLQNGKRGITTKNKNSVGTVINFYKAILLNQTVSTILEQCGSVAVPTLINALSDELNVIRQTVANVLGNIGDTRAIEPLIYTLQTENDNPVCQAIINALAKFGDERAIQPIINTISRKKIYQSHETALALKGFGKPAIEPLLELLKNGNEYARESAAFICIHLNDERTVPALLSVINDDKSPKVREQALISLGFFKDEGLLEPLIQLLKDQNDKIRENALEQLDKFAKGNKRLLEPLTEALFDPTWKNNYYKRADLLATLGEKALEPLLKALNHENENIRWAGAHSLAKIKDNRAILSLVNALKDKSSKVRAAVCYALREIGESNTFEPILKMLNDEDEEVRAAAASALGKIGKIRAVEPLLELLNDPSEKVLGTAAYQLGKLQETRAVEPLIKLLKVTTFKPDYDEYNVRYYVAKALGEIGDKRAVEPLIEALEDEDSQVRFGAAVALGKLGEEWTIPYLEKIAQLDKGFMPYSGGKVSEAAAKAIRQIKGLPEVDG